ncbi:MAG: PHP domain-containing protein [Bacteroidales bacterium]
MNLFKADLHIHTVLSPCGDLEMSPYNIIVKAKQENIHILGITDHNSARQCRTVRRIAEKEGIFILCGMEITTKEEVHCLAFFDSTEALEKFDKYVYDNLADIKNEPEKFGYQVVVDEDELITEEPEKLLISATTLAIDEVEKKVHEAGGLFIPAHIDRLRNGIIGQLGFIPPGLNSDALELSRFTNYDEFIKANKEYSKHSFIHSSDAHYLNEIGQATSDFYLKELSFDEIKMALHRKNGRKVLVNGL